MGARVQGRDTLRVGPVQRADADLVELADESERAQVARSGSASSRSRASRAARCCTSGCMCSCAARTGMLVSRSSRSRRCEATASSCPPRTSTPASTGACGCSAASTASSRSRSSLAVWEDEEWPAGDDLVTLATERVARNAAPHMRTALLVPELYLPVELVCREDDDSPLLRTFLELAMPAPEPARGS
jgi:hypothetical protein